MDKVHETPFIEVSGLYQIFGNTPKKIMPLVNAGKSKDDILAETGHTVGLKDINLKIHRGEIFVIMGLSGSGKSTLIRHFNRLIDPTEGQIKVEGEDIMKFPLKELTEFRRHKMSMVFQNFGLMPHRNVIDNVSYGLSVQGTDKTERYKSATQWLETVGLAGYEEQYPAQLSGGQQQRVGLARALCTNAEILLMDEAFSALDPLIRSEMQDQLVQLQNELQKTIIFITHDLDEALRIGDRIAILKDGELIQIGSPVDILLNPADDYVEAFVKDVNRARAVPVKTIMQQTVPLVTKQGLQEALNQLAAHDYAFYQSDNGFEGILLKETLEKALIEQPSGNIQSEHILATATVKPDTPLEFALPKALLSHYALPVLNKEGKHVGELRQEDLASTLDNSV
ncbi:glycine betaine/L-proline ABC transporter ATP-binding protein [Marinomonas sp. 15G1-11]|uniref:Quaternary amine transport ATP-binding protein n=1 Tax=Marinomonas phaeophyticola TaxID=3004091 RepID=A0ABT4JR63_9GAMM|nr:glycine betaine/L-proline ABC transporter ATP-binding protein [Marinomonas sp. 15G1-11]MCZ2720882.1 glycine betaine/L-proline ABC transporter ATP-binding protein [Marinomonas sp. 15G1-11]